MGGKERVSICSFLYHISLYIRSLNLNTQLLLYRSITRNTEKVVGAFFGRIGLPPAVMGCATSCDDGL